MKFLIGFLDLKGTAVKGKSSSFWDDRADVDSTVLLIAVFDRLSYSQSSHETAYRDRLSMEFCRDAEIGRSIDEGAIYQSRINPCRNPSVTASVRLETPSLEKIELM